MRADSGLYVFVAFALTYIGVHIGFHLDACQNDLDICNFTDPKRPVSEAVSWCTCRRAWLIWRLLQSGMLRIALCQTRRTFEMATWDATQRRA